MVAACASLAFFVGRVADTVELLWHGDLEKVAPKEGLRRLTLPSGRLIYVGTAGIAGEVFSNPAFVDRGGGAGVGLTRSRDTEAYRAARAATASFFGSEAVRHICASAELPAEGVLDARAYSQRVADATLRRLVFGKCEETAGHVREAAVWPRLEIAATQVGALAADDLFGVVDAFTNIDAKLKRRSKRAVVSELVVFPEEDQTLLAALKGFDDEQVAATARDVLVAGSQTTAEALAATLRGLASGDPDTAVQRAFEENAFARLAFRIASRDATLAGTFVERGACVVLPLKGAGFPFGGGQRSCVGRSVALALVSATARRILDRFHVARTSDDNLLLIERIF